MYKIINEYKDKILIKIISTLFYKLSHFHVFLTAVTIMPNNHECHSCKCRIYFSKINNNFNYNYELC